MKRWRVWVVVAVVVLMAMTLLWRRAAHTVVPNSVTLPARVVRLEGDGWSGYAYFRAEDFLKGTDYKYDEETDQKKRADKLTEGRTNFLVTSMDQFMSNRPAGRIVAVIDESTGADALVLNNKKHSYLTSAFAIPRLVADLRQKGQTPVLAYSGNTPSEFLMQKLANTREELPLSDFKLESVTESTAAFKLLQEGKADVAIVWEPETTAAAREGYVVALSSKDVPHSIIDILVASDAVIQRQPELVQSVVDGLYDARRRALADPAAFTAFIAKDGKLQVADAEALLKGIHLFDAAEADRFMNQRVPPLDETGAFEAMENIGGLLNLSDATITADVQLIDGRFVAKSAQRR